VPKNTSKVHDRRRAPKRGANAGREVSMMQPANDDVLTRVVTPQKLRQLCDVGLDEFIANVERVDNRTCILEPRVERAAAAQRKYAMIDFVRRTPNDTFEHSLGAASAERRDDVLHDQTFHCSPAAQP
jgi:hypothetical protein